MSAPRPAPRPVVPPPPRPAATASGAWWGVRARHAWRRSRRSVAGRVALVLVLAQLATGFIALGLTAALIERKVEDLAVRSFQSRLEAVADELQVSLDPAQPLDAASPALVADVARRFADPVALVHADGTLALAADTLGRPLPVDLDLALAAGDVEVHARPSDASWAAVPLYSAAGNLIGGLVVAPLGRTLDAEKAPLRRGYAGALGASLLVGIGVALVLGGALARGLIRPLTTITRGVERVGAGEYDVRLDDALPGEIGRLAASVNAMAADVSASVETLRTADRMRRDLVTNVGHDVRTPLAALSGYAEEAERHLNAGDLAAARRDLAAARRQADQLGRLIRDLFELSVLESHPDALRREPVPLGELLHDVAATHAGLMQRAGVAFDVDVPAGMPLLEADGARLVRLVGNLLDNARAHTPAGGRVALRARAENGQAVVEVEDTGSGIDPDVLPHLFSRYYRGSDARTRRGEGGTGLGLAIAHETARRHGGTLVAEAAAEQGSVFRLALPLPEEV